MEAMGFFGAIWGKITAFFTAVIAFLANLFGGWGLHASFRNEYTVPETAAPYTRINTAPKTDWTARYIWDSSDGGEKNVWMCLRRTVTLDEAPETLTAYISADSRYWLYVNGECAVFEGGVKRGPTAADGYYDTVELAPFLQPGKNVIAALVWYWGKDTSFSNTDSGKAGFLFEAGDIVSDGAWKARRNAAYQNDTGGLQPNFRLPESNVCYNANLEPGDWLAPDFNDADWENATECGVGGCEPWGMLYPRGIPLLKDYGLKDYENSKQYKNRRLSFRRKLRLDIPYNAQCTPYLKIESKAGKKIRIMTENTLIGAVSDTYVTKDGVQEFEALGWFNGEHITYEIPAGVKILELKYRETGYDTAFSGSFTCGDEHLNTLWQKSLRTLYVTMRDNFMDCPDRERAQWWGDVTNEMAMTMYALDANAYLLYQKGVASMLGHIDPATNVLQTVVPNNGDYFELPMQQLAGICGFWTYYLYTGDKAFLESVYEAALRYVQLWTIGPDGLAEHRPGTWDWMDWGSGEDVPAIENAWYYLALSCLRDMAAALGRSDDDTGDRMRRIRAGYAALWMENGYCSKSAGKPDDRANALAVLAGLADETQYDTITGVLTGTFHSSPYMEFYVLEALCRMGRCGEAKARMLQRYKGMIKYHYSTLWEHWNRVAGTLNHAWSGGPLVIMSKYFAGVRPLEPGWRKFEIRPQTAVLRQMDCTVPTVKGYIRVSCGEAGGTFTMDACVPANAEALIYVPYEAGRTLKLNGGVLYKDGRFAQTPGIGFVEEANGYAVFSVKAGNETRLRFETAHER